MLKELVNKAKSSDKVSFKVGIDGSSAYFRLCR